MGGLSKFLLAKCEEKMVKAGENDKRKIKIFEKFQK